MADLILHKRSSVAASVPSAAQLNVGEIAINTADGKVFIKKSDGTVVQVGGGAGSGTVTSITAGTGLTGGTITTSGTIAASFGSTAGTICQGNDSRLSDARTPTAHTHPLSDLTVSGAATNDVATWNGTAWVPQAPASSGAPVGAQYVVMTADGTLTNERVLTAGNHVTVTNGGSTATLDWRYNAAKRTIIESEMNATGNLTLNSSGTGATVAYTTAGLHDANRLGIGNIQTGTTTTGRAAIGSATIEQVTLGSGIVKFCAVVKVPTLSDGTNTFLVQAGLHDNLAGAPVDGLYFEYTHSVNAGDWTTYVYNNSGTTGGFDTNVAVATGNWYRLEIEINAAATQAIFSINGTVVQTFTGTIPNGAARLMGFMVQIRKTAGTTNRSVYADYIGFTTEVTR